MRLNTLYELETILKQNPGYVSVVSVLSFSFVSDVT